MDAHAERRSYAQYCGTARALDVLGERWTLLVVRDLLPGARRYKELAAGLRGIGTDLLTVRLRTLEDHGLVERTEIGGTGGGVLYRLTPAGEQLRPVVEGLARVGMHWLETPDRTDRRFSLAWALATVRMTLPPDAAPTEPIAFRGEGDPMLLRRVGQHMELTYEADTAGHTTLQGTDHELLAVLTGHLPLKDSGLVVIGDRRLARQWLTAIRRCLPEPLSI